MYRKKKLSCILCEKIAEKFDRRLLSGTKQCAKHLLDGALKVKHVHDRIKNKTLYNCRHGIIRYNIMGIILYLIRFWEEILEITFIDFSDKCITFRSHVYRVYSVLREILFSRKQKPSVNINDRTLCSSHYSFWSILTRGNLFRSYVYTVLKK